MMTTPTFSQIKAQVAAIRKKVPEARVIGIRSSGRWAGERIKRDGEETYLIAQCDSPLAMRIALREDAGPNATTVLITDLDDRELSDDILVRLTKRQLFPVDSWQIIKALFQAQAIDPRLTRHRWVADALMESIPEGGYPSAPGGFLDAESVWPILLRQGIGLASLRPDLLSILKWSIDLNSVARYRTSSSEFRQAAVAWLCESAGPAAEAILRCVESNRKPDALAIGLAAGVIFSAKNGGKLDRAAGKMEERFLGGSTPDEGVIGRWNAAATEVVRLQITDPRLKKNLLERSDEILTELGAEGYAYLSSSSPLGFSQRLESFGKELGRIVEKRQYDLSGDLVLRRAEISDHELAIPEKNRLEQLDMSIRLVRWLRMMEDRRPEESVSLVEAAKAHIHDGGFADWARLTLRRGDPVRQLSEAYVKLFDRVTEVRESWSQRFAELLRSWTEVDSRDDAITPVERLLDQVVAPLAETSMVLLIVVDGMSVAVCRELMSDLIAHEWIPLNREGSESFLSAGLAAIPSVTEVSRTSLFSGRLRQGSSSDETPGFAEHGALRARSRSGHPPVLFHKASLRGEGDAVLAAEVREKIGSVAQRVVGVVVNAVDDQLLKGEQIDTRWARGTIPVLPALLYEAKLSRRIVIITSDHGHVLDSGSKFKAKEGGERWRVVDGQPEVGEIRLNGPRVVMPESKTVIVPWTEHLRYGAKKYGYHGGASPQEMIVPIAVLSPTETFPDGWAEAPIDVPPWWDEPGEKVQATPVAAVPKPKAVKPKQTNLLFDTETVDEERRDRPQSASPAAVSWIDVLLDSPVFEQQKKLAGRSVPADDVLRGILQALDQRGGKMTSAALSRTVNYPSIRLRGLLAIVQRVLNIDGYAVLTRDDASDTVELNRSLLQRQFELK